MSQVVLWNAASKISNLSKMLKYPSPPLHRTFMITYFRQFKSAPIPLTNFFRIYFTFTYYLCITPYRIVFRDDDGWFHRKSWAPQKVLCILFHGLSSLFIIIDWHTESESLLNKSIPTKYFFGATDVIHYFFKLYSMQLYIFGGDRFLNMLNFVLKEKEQFSSARLKIEHPFFIILLYLLNVFLGLARASEQIFPSINDTWEWPWMSERYVHETRKIFFPSYRNATKMTIPVAEMTLSGLDYLLVIISSLGCVTSALVGYFMDLAVLLSVLTLWSPAYYLNSKITPIAEINFQCEQTTSEKTLNPALKSAETPTQTVLEKLGLPHTPRDDDCMRIISNLLLEKISVGQKQSEKSEKSYTSFKSVYTLSELVNHASGHMITFYMARAIFFNSASIDDAFVNSINSDRILWQCIHVGYTLTNMTILIMAADIHRRMEIYKLSFFDEENMSKIPSERLQMIVNELTALKVGIKGSKMFTVTFGVLWNVLSTVITYFIICLQD